MSFGRTVGIDYGTKRVGIAIADPLLLFAQPVGTFPPDEALRTLSRIQGDEGISCVVVGWPFEEDGKEGRAVQRVKEYVNRIRKLLPGVEFVKQDERHSSESAKEVIKKSGRPSLRSTGRERVDTAAAGIILQDYLDEKSGSPLS
ncbi:MAG: Holliday junction resolvase RuvX [Bacteroidetes bacterium]|nr:Holliday junction resolvase RuvX [Bacteroidota bacterium]MDA1333641.1 Holliday junction resolvase RuvX [Bacteroidota bacterium]